MSRTHDRGDDSDLFIERDDRDRHTLDQCPYGVDCVGPSAGRTHETLGERRGGQFDAIAGPKNPFECDASGVMVSVSRVEQADHHTRIDVD